jgi:hypothetical protein
LILTPKNWASFQHYKDRSPSWIKLHKALLDDYEFSCLPVASRALAPILWLLASEYDEGKINATLDKLAFRLRMTRGELAEALSPLIEKGFFDASEPLAECKQDAIPEKEREIENIDKRERENGAVAPLDPRFLNASISFEGQGSSRQGRWWPHRQALEGQGRERCYGPRRDRAGIPEAKPDRVRGRDLPWPAGSKATDSPPTGTRDRKGNPQCTPRCKQPNES